MNIGYAMLQPTPETRYNYKAVDFVHKMTGIEKAILILRDFKWLSDKDILNILVACADWVIIADQGMRQYYIDFMTPNTDCFDRAQMFVLNAYGIVFDCNVDAVTPGSIIHDICEKYVFVTTVRNNEAVTGSSGVFRNSLVSYAMCHTFVPIERELANRNDDAALELLVSRLSRAVNSAIACYLTEVISYATVDVTIGVTTEFDYIKQRHMINSPKYTEISDSLISAGINPTPNNIRALVTGAEFFERDFEEYVTRFLGSLLIRYLDVSFKFGFIDENSDEVDEFIDPILELFKPHLFNIGYDVSKFSLGLFKSFDNNTGIENLIKNRYTSDQYRHLHMGAVYNGKTDIVLHSMDIFYTKK